MAKELPYFKFEPAEYLTKDISFCSLSAQGLFINICSYYWQRNCDLTKEQLLKRLNYQKELDELIQEGVIDLSDNKIIIKFLDKQLEDVEAKSKINSVNGSKGGRPKKPKKESELKPNRNQTETEIKANENQNESESKGIREEEIIEDKIKKNNIEDRKLKFAHTLQPFIFEYGKELITEFYKYWTEPNKSNTKFKQELQTTWDLSRRLETWAKNDRNFNSSKNGKGNITSTEEFKDLTRAIRNTGDRI